MPQHRMPNPALWSSVAFRKPTVGELLVYTLRRPLRWFVRRNPRMYYSPTFSPHSFYELHFESAAEFESFMSLGTPMEAMAVIRSIQHRVA